MTGGPHVSGYFDLLPSPGASSLMGSRGYNIVRLKCATDRHIFRSASRDCVLSFSRSLVRTPTRGFPLGYTRRSTRLAARGRAVGDLPPPPSGARVRTPLTYALTRSFARVAGADYAIPACFQPHSSEQQRHARLKREPASSLIARGSEPNLCHARGTRHAAARSVERV